MARILDGKLVAMNLNHQLQDRLTQEGVSLQLAIILAGDNAASQSYIRGKQKAAQLLGIKAQLYNLPEEATTEEVLRLVRQSNQDPSITGILVQLPLPEQIDQHVVIEAIDPRKDVDGLTTHNMGLLLGGQPQLVPATARGVMAMLNHYQIDPNKKEAVVVGRSSLVGKPTALLLLQAGATVTIAHRQTANLAAITSMADILVVAAGQPDLITAEYVKDGAAVIDVGISRTEAGLKGDVDQQSVQDKVSALSPVPGGVGPLTIACLFQNLYQAYALQQADPKRGK